jgi:hypothetical protein
MEIKTLLKLTASQTKLSLEKQELEKILKELERKLEQAKKRN